MNQIDLTPPLLKQDVQRRKHLLVWLICAIVALSGHALWAGYTYWNYRKSNQQQQKTVQQYTELQNNIQSLTAAQSQLNHWEDRLVVLDQLGQYPDFVQLTNYLAQNSPELILLSEMNFRHETKGFAKQTADATALPKSSKMFMLNNSPASGSKSTLKPMAMSLKGHSVNHKVVADYLTVLNSSGLFLKTKLISSKRESHSTNPMIKFEIKCVVSPFETFEKVDYANITKTKTF